MNKHLNIINIDDDKVVLEGFTRIKNVMTVRYAPHSSRMIIIPEKLEENKLNTVIEVFDNREIHDIRFFELLDICSKNDKILFVESGNEYYQVEDIDVKKKG